MFLSFVLSRLRLSHLNKDYLLTFLLTYLPTLCEGGLLAHVQKDLTTCVGSWKARTVGHVTVLCYCKRCGNEIDVIFL